MPRKFDLTYFAARKRWKKKIRGKVHYFGRPCAKGDRDAYLEALREYQRYVTPDPFADLPEDATPHDLEALMALRRVSRGKSASELAALPGYSQGLDYARRLAHQPPPSAPAPQAKPATLSDVAAIFLAQLRQEVDAGDRAPKSYGDYKPKVDDFVGFALTRSITEPDRIDAALMDAYRAEQYRQLADPDDPISPSTAKKRLYVARRFAEWMHDRDYLDSLPKPLRKGYDRVAQRQPAPLHYTPQEVRTLYAAADPSMRLWIALAVNAAYTQTDIATLRHDHLDMDAGIIDRRRHKTTVPQVHRLWPITLRLLRDQATVPAKHDLVLLRDDGRPLISDYITQKGTRSGNDTIANLFRSLKTAVGMKDDPRSFKHLRKSAAHEVAQAYPAAPHCTSLFLAHFDASTARYYAERNHQPVFAACDHLDTIYHLADIE